MGKKYPEVEKHFITISIGLIIFFIVCGELIYAVYGYVPAMDNIMTAAYFFSVFLQLFFLTQMYKLSHLRESLYSKEIANMSLLAYSSDLEKHFSEIRSIKHDIKNLFFTMGQYVERSSDNEFKEFYKEKIFPFAKNQIQKNDLYARLMLIENEQLRAFLYYKLSQALELGVESVVEIQIAEQALDINMSFSDIVRILGILIDNAVEESMLIENQGGEIIIRITQNEEITSVRIQNKVTEERLKSGVKLGVSTKAKERGRGLRIVAEIIEKYDFAALNSYFQNDSFIQNLMIYTGTASQTKKR